MMFENEARMEGVQGRFPHDDLHLHDTCTHAVKVKPLNRRRSAPGALLLKSFGKRASSAVGVLPDLAPSRSQPQSVQEHRIYLLEGNVHLTVGLQTQERYFFLFSDILLIAKQKSSTTFRLKHRVRVCEVWLSNCCFDEVSETTVPTDRSFVIGWPTTNMVATFETSEMRDMWFSKIKEQIGEAREIEQPKSVILKVLNREFEGHVSKCITVSNVEDTDNVVRRCLDEFHVKTADVKDYQLWVAAGKEETPYPLIGHEHPYSIKMSFLRDALGSADDVAGALELEEPEAAAAAQLQFILRPTKKAPTKLSLEESGSKRKRFKKSPLISLFRKSRGSTQESSQESTSPPPLTPSGKLFGHSLTELCEDDAVPKPILGMMYQLFVHGPFTTGIFRRSANQRQCRELQETLDSGHAVAFDEQPILVIGATFKNFLRNLPDCLFECDLYEEWCDAVENIEDKAADKIKKIMEKLPKCHVVLIRYVMCVLHHITQRSDENQMTSINLGICIGPSLLWPSVAADMAAQADAARRVPLFVQCMIDNCRQILGEDTVQLFGDPPRHKSRPDSSTDSDSMHSVLSLQEQQGGLRRRIGSSLDSLDNDMETSGLLKTHLFQTNLSRDSGLTSSDTQLYSEQVEPQAIAAADLPGRKKSLTRSTSQFDEKQAKQEVDVVLSHSYDSALSRARERGEIPQPTAPPRKTRRRAPDPPADVKPLYQSDDSGTVQSPAKRANDHTTAPTSKQLNQAFRKQRSSESIGSSLDSYAGSLDSTDYPDRARKSSPTDMETDARQCNDIGELRKSASGAKIYLDEQLLSDSIPKESLSQIQRKLSPPTTTSSLPDQQQQHAVVVQRDGPRRAPPPMKEPPSYEESVLRTRGKAAEIRAKSASRHSWTVSPDPAPSDRASRRINAHGGAGRTSNTGTAKAAAEKRSTQPDQAQDDLYIHSSADHSSGALQHGQSNAPHMYASMHELHSEALLDQTEGPGPRYHGMRRGSDGTTQRSVHSQPEHKQPPVLRNLLAESGENKEEVLRKVRVGMTVKGGDIFPKHMRSIIRHSLHDEELRSARGRGIRKTGSTDDARHPQRSESFAARQRPGPVVGNHRLNVPTTRSVEKSASDTSVVDQFENNARRLGWKRPSKPPSYQEAMQRKSLLKSGPPLYQVSQNDVQRQREMSSRAAQLYMESMKRYQRQVDDPSDGRANEGHVPLDSHVDDGAAPQQSDAAAAAAAAAFRREPPPTRRVADVKHISDAGRVRKAEEREFSPPRAAQDAERHREARGGTAREAHVSRSVQAERHSLSPHRAETNTDVKHSRDQRRNSDPRTRSSSSRNRRGHSNSNTSTSSENESNKNEQRKFEENKVKREQQQSSRQQSPGYSQGNNRERHSRRNKPRDQRLSDTRLEKSNELNRQHKSGLTRSKSDSSEHINKLGRFKELQALDSNIIEQYRKYKLNAENEALKDSQEFGRPRRRSINSVRNRDWHKDLAEQYKDVFYMPPQETNNNSNNVIYTYARQQSITSDSEDSEKQKKRWQPPVHPSKDLIVVNNSNSKSQPQERPNGKKDRNRRSMPARLPTWGSVETRTESVEPMGKENNPACVTSDEPADDELGSARVKKVKDLVAEYHAPAPHSDRSSVKSQSSATPSRHHVEQTGARVQRPHSESARAHAHQPTQAHSYAPPSQAKTHPAPSQVVRRQARPDAARERTDVHVRAQSAAQPDPEDDAEAGLTWSVAELRNRFSQGSVFYDPSNKPARIGDKKPARELTNVHAAEEYI